MTNKPDAALRVWTVDAVGYPDECYQLGIAASEESAIALLEEDVFGHPYRVIWSERRDSDGYLEITGKFDGVRHYSVAHEATYIIAAAEVRP